MRYYHAVLFVCPAKDTRGLNKMRVDEELLQVSRRSYDWQNAETDYFALTTETFTDPQHVLGHAACFCADHFPRARTLTAIAPPKSDEIRPRLICQQLQPCYRNHLFDSCIHAFEIRGNVCNSVRSTRSHSCTSSPSRSTMTPFMKTPSSPRCAPP